MSPRRDHQMAARVRIPIQHHQARRRRPEQQPLARVTLGGVTEDAAALLLLRAHVHHPPRSPQNLHRAPRLRLGARADARVWRPVNGASAVPRPAEPARQSLAWPRLEARTLAVRPRPETKSRAGITLLLARRPGSTACRPPAAAAPSRP